MVRLKLHDMQFEFRSRALVLLRWLATPRRWMVFFTFGVVTDRATRAAARHGRCARRRGVEDGPTRAQHRDARACTVAPFACIDINISASTRQTRLDGAAHDAVLGGSAGGVGRRHGHGRR